MPLLIYRLAEALKDSVTCQGHIDVAGRARIHTQVFRKSKPLLVRVIPVVLKACSEDLENSWDPFRGSMRSPFSNCTFARPHPLPTL